MDHIEAASRDYGVVLRTETAVDVNIAATDQLRAKLRQRRSESLPMIDRGPGYVELRAREGDG